MFLTNIAQNVLLFSSTGMLFLPFVVPFFLTLLFFFPLLSSSESELELELEDELDLDLDDEDDDEEEDDEEEVDEFEDDDLDLTLDLLMPPLGRLDKCELVLCDLPLYLCPFRLGLLISEVFFRYEDDETVTDLGSEWWGGGVSEEGEWLLGVEGPR